MSATAQVAFLATLAAQAVTTADAGPSSQMDAHRANHHLLLKHGWARKPNSHAGYNHRNYPSHEIHLRIHGDGGAWEHRVHGQSQHHGNTLRDSRSLSEHLRKFHGGAAGPSHWRAAPSGRDVNYPSFSDFVLMLAGAEELAFSAGQRHTLSTHRPSVARKAHHLHIMHHVLEGAKSFIRWNWNLPDRGILRSHKSKQAQHAYKAQQGARRGGRRARIHMSKSLHMLRRAHGSLHHHLSKKIGPAATSAVHSGTVSHNGQTHKLPKVSQAKIRKLATNPAKLRKFARSAAAVARHHASKVAASTNKKEQMKAHLKRIESVVPKGDAYTKGIAARRAKQAAAKRTVPRPKKAAVRKAAKRRIGARKVRKSVTRRLGPQGSFRRSAASMEIATATHPDVHKVALQHGYHYVGDQKGRAYYWKGSRHGLGIHKSGKWTHHFGSKEKHGKGHTSLHEHLSKRLRPSEFTPSLRTLHGNFVLQLATTADLTSYARKELQRAGLFNKDSDYGGAIADSVMGMINQFASDGHSGNSAGMVSSIFDRVSRFKPLSPLTGADDEWNEVGPGMWQNNRCYSVFKDETGACYNAEGRVFRYPDGMMVTRYESRVAVAFPYDVPDKPEIVDVPFDADMDPNAKGPPEEQPQDSIAPTVQAETQPVADPAPVAA